MQSTNSIITILLVKDDPDDILLLQLALKRIPLIINLKLANTAEMLIPLLEKENPDMLFLDINLPGIDGISSIAEIRKIEAFNKLPIIMYSSSSLPEHIDQCYADGANFYIIKPISLEELVDCLKKVLMIDWSSACNIPSRSEFSLGKQE